MLSSAVQDCVCWGAVQGAVQKSCFAAGTVINFVYIAADTIQVSEKNGIMRGGAGGHDGTMSQLFNFYLGSKPLFFFFGVFFYEAKVFLPAGLCRAQTRTWRWRLQRKEAT